MGSDKELSWSNHDYFKFIVEGILLVFFGGIGLLGNLSCIVIFIQKKTLKCFHFLMLWLALFDSLYIINSILLFGIPSLYSDIYAENWYGYLVPIMLPLAQIGLTGSIYLTVAISIERYTTVVHPFFKIAHNWSSAYYVIPTTIFAILYNIPRFLELEAHEYVVACPENEFIINNCTENSTKVRVLATALRHNIYYKQVYNLYMNLLIHGLIPLLSLLYMNINVYTNLSRYSQYIEGKKNTIKMTEIMLAKISCLIVVVFVICHIVRWIPNIYEIQQGAIISAADLHWPLWIVYITEVSHLLTVINSSVNFYIYCFKNYRDKIGECLQMKRRPKRPGRRSIVNMTQTTALCQDSEKFVDVLQINEETAC